MKLFIASVIIVMFSAATTPVNQHKRIAGVLVGEGGEIGIDYELMTCTIRNRIDRGWTIRTVLNQYYAAYTEPTQQHLAIIENTLTVDRKTLSTECQNVYFFFADWYVKRWLNPNVAPVISIGGNSYYRYDDYRDLFR